MFIGQPAKRAVATPKTIRLYQMRKTTLAFCGVRTANTLMLGPTIHPTAEQRAGWLQKAGAMGAAL